MYKYRIEKLSFKNGFQIKPNSLTVIVGPNNSGKSRILKDILNLTTSSNPQTVILESVDYDLPDSLEDMEKDYPLNIVRDIYGTISLKMLSADMKTPKP